MAARERQPSELALAQHRGKGACGAIVGGSLHDGALPRAGGHVLEMQRRRLLLACAEVVAEGGLDGASVGRFCARARISRRTFYDLFDDREACFLALLDEACADINEKVAPAFRSGKGWRERIRGALVGLLEHFDEQPDLARVCVGETLKGGAQVFERRSRLLGVLATIVDEGRTEVRRGDGPGSLTAESVVGGAIAVVYARLYEDGHRPLTELVNPLMSMIVHPYLGSAAARRELERPVPIPRLVRGDSAQAPAADPFKDLSIRITFRTARVLGAIATWPGSSNRQVGDAAGVPDQGQISKLLSRLERYGLVQNSGLGRAKGEPNAWTLTPQGQAVRTAIEAPPG